MVRSLPPTYMAPGQTGRENGLRWSPVTLLRLTCLVLPAFSSSANAHDWYSGSRNPVTGHSCCGVSDCVPLSPGAVRYESGNIIFLYPLDGREYSIPVDQALPSPDGKNHGCVWGKGLEGGPKLCFFVGGGF